MGNSDDHAETKEREELKEEKREQCKIETYPLYTNSTSELTKVYYVILTKRETKISNFSCKTKVPNELQEIFALFFFYIKYFLTTQSTSTNFIRNQSH